MSIEPTPTANPGPEQGLQLKQWIQEHPDFPKPGILFRCMMPMLRDPQGWQEMVRQMGAVCERLQPDLIVGIESRGFIVGSALATALALPFAPVRKRGKLPGAVHGIDYTLEYGSDRLEIHVDGFDPQPSVLVVDDLLATGGTAAAAGELVTLAGGRLCGFAFVIELAELNGRRKLPAGVPVESLVVYS
ncbi:MAG: adenine phosphoribosyltransferase [Synechococcaceae cyanobacterium ELA263]